MPDIPGFSLDTQTLITTIGIAILTAMAVSNFIKPFLEARRIYKTDPRYALYVNLSALVVAELFSLAGLIIAQLAFEDPPVLLLGLVRGFAAAFFATGGYEVYNNLMQLVAGRNRGGG